MEDERNEVAELEETATAETTESEDPRNSPRRC